MTVSRLQPFAITVFAEMSALAARIGAVNLGQGFPDEDGPPAMLKTAENAIAEGVNQFAGPDMGDTGPDGFHDAGALATQAAR